VGEIAEIAAEEFVRAIPGETDRDVLAGVSGYQRRRDDGAVEEGFAEVVEDGGEGFEEVVDSNAVDVVAGVEAAGDGIGE
jgi:hypothetical protein